MLMSLMIQKPCEQWYAYRLISYILHLYKQHIAAWNPNAHNISVILWLSIQTQIV